MDLFIRCASNSSGWLHLVFRSTAYMEGPAMNHRYIHVHVHVYVYKQLVIVSNTVRCELGLYFM